MTEKYQNMLITNTDGVVKLTFNRPPLNVLNIEMLNEINHALEAVLDNRALKLLIITGNGKAFSAGVDVAEHLPDKAREMLATFHRTFDLLSEIAAPTLAALNGVALGGGCEVALFCDLVIAAESVKLGQPEIKLATLPPVAAALLPKLCGAKKAFELLLIGDAITARDAKRLGLVNRVVADSDLESEVEAVTKKLTALSPDAVKLTKRAIRQGLDKNFAEGFNAADALCLEMLLHHPDTREGLQAFIEKRPPAFGKSA
ncbi:MAG: enoyl-CoA hydratase/isomerase family protein [Acidobacteriota bacterium]